MDGAAQGADGPAGGARGAVPELAVVRARAVWLEVVETDGEEAGGRITDAAHNSGTYLNSGGVW